MFHLLRRCELRTAGVVGISLQPFSGGTVLGGFWGFVWIWFGALGLASFVFWLGLVVQHPCFPSAGLLGVAVKLKECELPKEVTSLHHWNIHIQPLRFFQEFFSCVSMVFLHLVILRNSLSPCPSLFPALQVHFEPRESYGRVLLHEPLWAIWVAQLGLGSFVGASFCVFSKPLRILWKKIDFFLRSKKSKKPEEPSIVSSALAFKNFFSKGLSNRPLFHRDLKKKNSSSFVLMVLEAQGLLCWKPSWDCSTWGFGWLGRDEWEWFSIAFARSPKVKDKPTHFLLKHFLKELGVEKNTIPMMPRLTPAARVYEIDIYSIVL